jgi:hypothetical protein
MALTDKERQAIIEEERVRWETRRALMQDAWAQNGQGYGSPAYRRRYLRLLFWFPILGLVAWILSRAFPSLAR